EPDIDLHVLLRFERPRVVVANPRVLRHTADRDARIVRSHIRDHHTIRLAAVLDVQCETRRALGVARVMMRGQDGSAEGDRVTVFEGAVDLDGLELRAWRVAETEIQLAARLEQLLV